ncbi:MAG: T9SS type A sorting domain-containing protein, partial [Calditrichaeota bacterium]|nr:T9SS type A sorting domain-containing protein [Calditrichota bacterium]
ATFELQQNYPNPFNGETTIPFFLPAAAEVTLTVYNVLGQEVAVITRQHYGAGQHYLKWHAGTSGTELSSGIFFLQMTARPGSGREIRLPAQKALYMK